MAASLPALQGSLGGWAACTGMWGRMQPQLAWSNIIISMPCHVLFKCLVRGLSGTGKKFLYHALSMLNQ